MSKIQVGPNVWIRPNLGQSVPEYEDSYYAVWPSGAAIKNGWSNAALDYALLNTGNFFLSREAAEQAIIKPVDPTPITYKQWLNAGRPLAWGFTYDSKIVKFDVQQNTKPMYFDAYKCWLTREAAEAWRDQWERENGEVKP